MRPAAVAVAAALTLGLAGPAASSLLFSTVAKGTAARGEPPRAYLAFDRSGVARFSAELRKADRARVRAVDFRRFAVVAAFVTLPTPCHAYDVASLARKRRTLVVSLVVGEQQGPCILPITPAYQVVKVKKTALAPRRPTRAILRVVEW